MSAKKTLEKIDEEINDLGGKPCIVLGEPATYRKSFVALISGFKAPPVEALSLYDVAIKIKKAETDTIELTAGELGLLKKVVEANQPEWPVVIVAQLWARIP